MERKKLELQLNTQTSLQLLNEKPFVGKSQYGEYYLYTVLNGDGSTEYSYFAPAEVHDQLKDLKKGTKFNIMKYAELVGKKLVTKHNVQIVSIPESEKTPSDENISHLEDNFFDIMMKSYDDALKIQSKYNGLIDPNRAAITLFIARSKVNGFGG